MAKSEDKPRTYEEIRAKVEEAMDLFEDAPDGAFWAMVAEYAGFEGGGLADIVDYLT